MKKSVSVLMAVFMLFATLTPVQAIQAQPDVKYTPPDIVQPTEYFVAPRFVAINSIRATFSMRGNTATATGSVSHSGARANVRVILQRSTDGGRTFSDFATLVNRDFTTRTIAVEGTRSNLDTSFVYRTRIVVSVFDANGRQIDSGTAHS